jgi:hypothetical protein
MPFLSKLVVHLAPPSCILVGAFDSVWPAPLQIGHVSDVLSYL